MIVQRVASASVKIDNVVCGQIDRGMLILLGVQSGDGQTDADYLIEKTIGLRIFEDNDGKMNLSIEDIGGSILVVSQFTLLGDCRKGRRPSFIHAAKPDEGDRWYQYFVEGLRRRGLTVETGQFQTHMQVELVNDGPVTLMVDSHKQF